MFASFLPPEEPRAPEFDDISAFDESDIARIDAWLQEQVELSEFPSLSVAIVRDGKTVYQRAFGYENTWANRTATTNTAYHVASVTKAFTASLAVLLHDRGVVDLDQPVVNYLPAGVSLSTQTELGATITLRQLASHTSGLPRGVPGRVQSVEGRYELEPERLYGLLAKVTLEFDPGTDDLYSNLGFGLLGHALELAADKPLNQLLQELLCDPLKLERTAFHVDDKLPVATGYKTPPQLPEVHSYRRRLAGSGGLVTSTGDLAKFLVAHMKPGLFTSEMLAQLHIETRLVDGSEINRALGWSIDTSSPTGRILSKNGGRGNCSAWIGFAPAHRVGVAVIANMGEPDVDPIGRWLLERSVPGGHRPVTKHGYAKVAPYTGVRWENDRPIVRVRDRWSPLVSINGLPIDLIMEHARKEFGILARKRFAEDLPELLSTMGHDPEWKVTLGLETGDGQIEQLQVRMTEQNRELVRD
jgi:CubicO group peptidase (beta-lactamase class C family)